MNQADESRKWPKNLFDSWCIERVPPQRIEKTEKLPFADVLAAPDVLAQREGTAFSRVKHQLVTRRNVAGVPLPSAKYDQSAALLGKLGFGRDGSHNRRCHR